MNILNTGLKCAIKKKKNINKFNVYIDIHKYVRKIYLKKYYLGVKSNSVKMADTATIGLNSFFEPSLNNESTNRCPQVPD